MKYNGLFSSFRYVTYSCCLAACTILPVRGQTVTYNFESPRFTLSEVTPLLNRAPNIGSPLFSADFLSSPDAGGLQIANFQPNILTVGQILYAPNIPEFMTINLNTPVYGVTFDFATISPGVLKFTSSAGNATQNSAVVGGSFPGGTLAFSSGTSFTSFQLEALDLSSTQIEFAIDNMILTVPEPSGGGLLLLGASAFVWARRFRR